MIQPTFSFPARIIFVRHGHVEGISPERFRGRTDLPLTPLGTKQALATAEFIASNWPVGKVYSSPLKRCMDTAKEIAKKQNLKVHQMESLIDIDYGKWQGETVEHVKITDYDAYKLWTKHPQYAVIEDGETLADVQARLTRAFNKICKEDSGQSVIVVGHDSTIRIFLMLILGLPLSAYWQIKQDPCAINLVNFGDGACQVEYLNDIFHLGGLR